MLHFLAHTKGHESSCGRIKWYSFLAWRGCACWILVMFQKRLGAIPTFLMHVRWGESDFSCCSMIWQTLYLNLRLLKYHTAQIIYSVELLRFIFLQMGTYDHFDCLPNTKISYHRTWMYKKPPPVYTCLRLLPMLVWCISTSCLTYSEGDLQAPVNP